MAKLTAQELIEAIKELTVLELNEQLDDEEKMSFYFPKNQVG